MSDKEYHPDDEAELEEFLQGRGELARHLQALPQAAPSAELDQAIMAKVEAGLKQAVPAPMPAANDARIPDSEAGNHAPARRRWWLGAPLTTAASVAIVGFLSLQWRHQLELDAPASPPLQVAGPAQANRGTGASPEPQALQTPPAPSAPSAPLAPLAPQPPVSAAPPAPAAPPAAKVKAAETEKAAVAPARPERADATPAAPSQAGRIEITGSAIRSAAPAAPIAPTSPMVAPAPAPAPLAPSPPAAPVAAPAAIAAAQGAARFAAADAGGASRKESQPAGFSQQQAREARDWLALIEELLKADLRQDALNEWGKFHQAYPDYPVPEQVRAQIRALQK